MPEHVVVPEGAKRIDARIAELQRLRVSLTECIGCGCLSIERCRLANLADRAGRQGAGPRYWLEQGTARHNGTPPSVPRTRFTPQSLDFDAEDGRSPRTAPSTGFRNSGLALSLSKED